MRFEPLVWISEEDTPLRMCTTIRRRKERKRTERHTGGRVGIGEERTHLAVFRPQTGGKK